MEKKFENSRSIFRIYDGNIVDYEFKKNIHIDVLAAKQDFDLYWSFIDDNIGQDTKIKSVVILPSSMDVDQDAIKYFRDAFKDKEHRGLKQAWVCPTYYSRILVYIYSKMRSPIFESKTFSNKDKALEWLKS